MIRIGGTKTAYDATDVNEPQSVQCGHGKEAIEFKYLMCQTTQLLKIKNSGQMPPVPEGRFNQKGENFLAYSDLK